MTDTQVPLWAFLLASLLTVVVPLVVTGIANRHALKLQRLENRNRVYDECLSILGGSIFTIGHAENVEVTTLTTVQATVFRLYAVGSKDVLKATEVMAEKSRDLLGPPFGGPKGSSQTPQGLHKRNLFPAGRYPHRP